MPIPIQSKIGIPYLWQPLFCQQLGIYSIEPITQEQYSGFFQSLYSTFKYAAKYSLNVENPYPTAEFLEAKPLYTHHLALDKPYPEIRAGYNRDRKLNLKRALKAEQQIIESQDLSPLMELFRENTADKVLGGTPNWAYPLLGRVFDTLLARSKAQLYYTVKPSGEITSGVMLAFHRNQVIYLFNAGKERFKRENGRTLILDSFFQKHGNSSLIFDFESPSVDPIAEFYKSFGAIPQPFYQIRYNRLPWWISLGRKVKGWLR